MLRIVGIQRDPLPDQEFVLLQNQGGMRVSLRGHVLLRDDAITPGELTQGLYVFPEDVDVPSGAFVMLTTGAGAPRWGKTKDGQLVYQCYTGRPASLWHGSLAPLHILRAQHSFAERREPALSIR